MSKPAHEYIYGLNPCFEVLRADRRKIHAAFLSENSSSRARVRRLVNLLRSKAVPVEWVDRHRLFELSHSREHQGAVLKASPYRYARFEDLLERPRLLLLDNVEDPHNVGAILRSADIFGFPAVLLPIKGVPEIYPSVVKVSAGACEHLNIARECSANDYVNKAREKGFTVVVLHRGGTVNLREMKRERLSRILLVIGGEDESVGQYIINHADYVVSIKQKGRINSLNASVAAGVAMFALTD